MGLTISHELHAFALAHRAHGYLAGNATLTTPAELPGVGEVRVRRALQAVGDC